MKLLHYSMIVILTIMLVNTEHAFAGNDSVSHLNAVTTDYGGNGIMVNSNRTVTPFLPSPPLGMYHYTSKIFSVFQIDPEIVHPNGTSSIHILVTNNANFTLYDVSLGESVNDSKSMLFSNIHKIDILNPNQTKTIFGTLHVFSDVRPTDYYDIWWNVVAKNQTGNMMESMQFHRNLPIAQNLPQYCCDKPVTITLESPLKQFRHGTVPKDVTCWQGFQLIFKVVDNSPACVNPYTALRLAQIGWTESNGSEMQQLPDPSSALKLNLSVNPVLVHPREVVGIKISVNNTFSNPIYVVAQNKWAYENLDSPCKKIRLGVAILDGYYTATNMTEGKNLQLFNKYDCSSWNLESGKVYEFQAQSNQVKEIMCYYYFGEPCHSEGINMNYGFDGYWDKNNTKQPFNAGTYTVIGADEWGHVVIQHFTVANSKTYTTSISQPMTVQTTDVHGTIKDIATSMPSTKLASSSTGVQIARGGCCDLYDNDSIKLELYHGKRSDSHMIAAVVENVGKRTVHIYGIHVSGFIEITNSSSTLNLMVLQDDPNITPKGDAILEPGESQTKYIVGNWTLMGKPVNGFSADTSYSYDDLENYNGITNGYSTYIPVQWIKQ